MGGAEAVRVRGCAWCFPIHKGDRASHFGGPFPEEGQHVSGLRSLFHGGRRSGLGGYPSRRARLRGEVLHRSPQLEPGGEQHPGVFHRGCDQVSRPCAWRQDGGGPGVPQTASAHDTFGIFISLLPEWTHMVMWAVPDRTLPQPLRMMEGFGVHTFRLVNAGASRDS